MKKTAYIGSTNCVKVSAAQIVLQEFEIDVVGVEVNSTVGKQPKNDEETLRGAINRATNLPKHHLRIGLEAGIEILNDVMYLTNYGALIDENNNLYTAGGTRIPLPREISDLILNDNLELSDAMERYFAVHDIKHNNGAIGYFTNNMVIRQDIFIHIVKLLYGQYLYNQKTK